MAISLVAGGGFVAYFWYYFKMGMLSICFTFWFCVSCGLGSASIFNVLVLVLLSLHHGGG